MLVGVHLLELVKQGEKFVVDRVWLNRRRGSILGLQLLAPNLEVLEQGLQHGNEPMSTDRRRMAQLVFLCHCEPALSILKLLPTIEDFSKYLGFSRFAGFVLPLQFEGDPPQRVAFGTGEHGDPSEDVKNTERLAASASRSVR
jgi:hypothetical protein